MSKVRKFPNGIDVVNSDAVFEGTNEATFILVEPNLFELAPSTGKAQS
jgi:hypothetical protein